jgi:hypothetical protein
MTGTSDTIDEAVTVRLLDRGLPPWATPAPVPPGDPVARAIADIRQVTGQVRRPCSARDLALALDSLSSTLESVGTI